MADEPEVQVREEATVNPPGEEVSPEPAEVKVEGPAPSEDEQEIADLQSAIEKAATPEEKAAEQKKLNAAFAKLRRGKKEAEEKALQAIQDAAYQRGIAEARQQKPEPVEQKPPEPAYQIPEFTKAPPVAPREYDYEDTGEYEKARAKYEMDRDEYLVEKAEHRAYHKAKADIAQAQADREHELAVETFGKWKTQGLEKFSDFLEVAKPDTVQLTVAMREAIRNSDMSHEIAYYLGQNPQEYSRVMGMQNPYAQAAAIGKIEDRLKNKPKPNTKTNAPEPIKPVPVSGPTEIPDEKLGDKEWLERERKRCLERGRLY